LMQPIDNDTPRIHAPTAPHPSGTTMPVTGGAR
ncbi:MAG: hypothetical protein V7637_1317, partial [Mycobacteriales bacterium]